MPKGYKIKRYKHIYGNNYTPLKLILCTVGILCGIFVLGFIGWNAYGPIRAYLSGTLSVATTSSSTESTSLQSEIDSSSSESEALHEPVASSELKGIYIPVSILTDPVKLDNLLNTLSRTEINTVLFDLKDTGGTLLYQSKTELAKQTGAQAENAYDLSALCNKLEEHHLTAMARLHAFRDPIAASKISSAGIKYLDSEMLWLDNSPDSGGKPWLNPYSDLARAYISDLATESIAMGVQHILLDSVQFPSGFGQEYADYGMQSTQITRSDVLSSFIDSMDRQITDLGAQMSVYVSGISALGIENNYYGSNPLVLTNKNVVIGVMPSQFGDGLTLENVRFEQPVLNPGETVETLLKVLAPDVAGKYLTALLQAYPADYTLTYNKMYTIDDINAQIGAAAKNNVQNYIIYHPNGTYPFA